MTTQELPEHLWYVGQVSEGKFHLPRRLPGRIYPRDRIQEFLDPRFKPNQKAHWLFLAPDGSAVVVFNNPKSIQCYPDLDTAKVAAKLKSNL